jgi:hypothetical protein
MRILREQPMRILREQPMRILREQPMRILRNPTCCIPTAPDLPAGMFCRGRRNGPVNCRR